MHLNFAGWLHDVSTSVRDFLFLQWFEGGERMEMLCLVFVSIFLQFRTKYFKHGDGDCSLVAWIYHRQWRHSLFRNVSFFYRLQFHFFICPILSPWYKVKLSIWKGHSQKTFLLGFLDTPLPYHCPAFPIQYRIVIKLYSPFTA